jgi:hypothetical protein
MIVGLGIKFSPFGVEDEFPKRVAFHQPFNVLACVGQHVLNVFNLIAAGTPSRVGFLFAFRVGAVQDVDGDDAGAL